MNKIFLKYCVAISLVLINQWALSQVTISGPVCILPGTTYQYNIQGSWDSASAMQICITGGVFVGGSGANQCITNGGLMSSVLVVWNNTNTGSLTVSSAKSNANLNVNIISLLNAGTVSSEIKSQRINSGTTPLSISCTAATGGSCLPIFGYQWQESLNSLAWKDIPGATAQNLNFSTPINETKYYRRRTQETVSGTIAYSDIAMVGSVVLSPAKN